MSTSALSLEQAPPISVPLRFFLTAPLFGLLAAGVLAAAGPAALTSRWHPALLAATHLITLGVLALCMVGALLQMLPVVAGAVLRRPVRIAWLLHPPLVIGTLLLAAGFAWGRTDIALAALPLLAWSLLALTVHGLAALGAAPVRNATTRGMRMALAALAVTVSLGLLAAWHYAGHGTLALPVLADVHLSWGLLGWVGLLVIGVAYQVVPMFQMTPPYPPWLARVLDAAILLGLCALSVGRLWDVPAAQFLALVVLLAGFLSFALATLHLQQKRRRRQADVTLRFWRVAMASLLAAALATTLAWLVPAWDQAPVRPLFVGILWIMGFALSAVNGMLYKIVPFLVWLHLQSRHPPRGSTPNMKQVIADAQARHQALAHEVALLLLAAAPFLPALFYPALAASALSFLLLGRNLLAAWRCYLDFDRRITRWEQAASR